MKKITKNQNIHPSLKYSVLVILLSTTISFALASCTANENNDGSEYATNAVETLVMLEARETALDIALADLTQEAGSATDTPVPAELPSPTNTLQAPPPSLEPQPLPSNTPKQMQEGQYTISTRGDSALIYSETIPDGTRLGPGTKFTKTWNLVNSGATTWTSDFAAVLVSGNSLDGPNEIPIAYSVTPDMPYELTLELTAPQAYGNYRSEWMLRNANGEYFGLGAQNIHFWLDIQVADLPSQTQVPDFIEVVKITQLVVTNHECANYTFELSGYIRAFKDFGFYDNYLTYNWEFEGESDLGTKEMDGFISDNGEFYTNPVEFKYHAQNGDSFTVRIRTTSPDEETSNVWAHENVFCKGD